MCVLWAKGDGGVHVDCVCVCVCTYWHLPFLGFVLVVSSPELGARAPLSGLRMVWHCGTKSVNCFVKPVGSLSLLLNSSHMNNVVLRYLNCI